MKLALVALLALAPLAPAAGKERARNCVTCHGAEAKLATNGVHAKGGVDCITCHGGVADEVEVARAHAGLRKLKDPRESVEVCGVCHSDVERMRSFGLRTDQLSLYWTSRHGARLAETGDADVATCVTCHGSHGVLSVRDPLSPVHERRQIDTCGRCHSDATTMARYGLPADVVESFTGSVHGKALLEDAHPAAPVCTDCHGSHGALPPRIGDVELVCGHCHSVVQEHFDRGAHSAAGGAEHPLQCTACHDNHGTEKPSPAMFLGDDVGHCGNCHSGEGDKALEIGSRLHADIDRLQATIRGADEAIAAAAVYGLFLGEERGYVEEARGLLVRARTMTHTIDPAALDDVLNRGQAMVQTTLESLDTKHRKLRDRRIFTGIFFAVAVAFAIALLMHGRDLGGRWKRAKVHRSEARRA